MSLPAWRFYNVAYRLATRHLDTKEKDSFDRALESQGRALEKLAALRAQLGTPLAVERVEPPTPRTKIGRWHREAPPGWDDHTVQRQNQTALDRLSRRPDVQA